MTLEQLNEWWEREQQKAAAHGPEEEESAGVDIEELFLGDTDKDDPDFDAEEHLTTACDLLHEAMDILCLLSHKRREHLTARDKGDMVEVAQSIFSFLEDIGDITEEDR